MSMIDRNRLLLLQLQPRREAVQLSLRSPRSPNLLKFPNLPSLLKLLKLLKLLRSPKQPRIPTHPKANPGQNPRRAARNLQMATRNRLTRTPRR